MLSEKEKMLSGKLYDPSDPELKERLRLAHHLCALYNQLDETKEDERQKILRELLPNADESTYLQGPIYFDYGENTYIGKNFYANFNLTILDCAPVYIGDNVFIGVNVSLVTPVHPLHYKDRNCYYNEKGIKTDSEYAKGIKIGNNCWLASNIVITGGIEIGDGSVIGAGSVVTHSIPANSLAFGNPCRVYRSITEEDRKEILKLK